MCGLVMPLIVLGEVPIFLLENWYFSSNICYTTFHFRSNASKFSVSVDPENTSVAGFKEQIAKEADVSAPCQRLIYRGRVLKDDHQLSFYGMYNVILNAVRVLPSPCLQTLCCCMIRF